MLHLGLLVMLRNRWSTHVRFQKWVELCLKGYHIEK